MHIYSGISSLAVTIFRLKTLRIAKPSDTFYFLLRYTASFMYLLFNSGGLATQPQFHPGCDHQGDLHHEPQLSQGPLLYSHAGGLQQDYHVGPPPPCIHVSMYRHSATQRPIWHDTHKTTVYSKVGMLR